MKIIASLIAGIVIVFVVGTVLAQSSSPGKDPVPAAGGSSQPDKTPAEPARAGAQPARDHEWLKQLVGEWTTTLKVYFQPDAPAGVSNGTESVRSVGEHWALAEINSTMMGAPYSGVMMLGYDSVKQQFQGAWIDSSGSPLWIYKGTLNEPGDTLTLETEGPSPMQADKTIKYKQVIRIIDKDSRTMDLLVENEDGTWTRIVSNEHRRKE